MLDECIKYYLINVLFQIFRAFYALIWSSTVVSVSRCLVSMTFGVGASSAGDVADRLLWVLLRFCLLSTEMSVLVFGLAGGQLDSKGGIRRVVVVTSVISLAFSITQVIIMFKYHRGEKIILLYRCYVPRPYRQFLSWATRIPPSTWRSATSACSATAAWSSG